MTLIQNEDAKYTLTLFENEKKYNQRKAFAKEFPETFYQDENFISDVTADLDQSDVKTQIQINSTNEPRFASETNVTISMFELSSVLKTVENGERIGHKLLQEGSVNDLNIFSTLIDNVGYAQTKQIIQSMGIIGWTNSSPYQLYSVWTDAINDDTTIVKFEVEAEESEEDQVKHKVEYLDSELTESEMIELGLFQLENIDTNEVYYIQGQDLERFMCDHQDGEHLNTLFTISQFSTEV